MTKRGRAWPNGSLVVYVFVGESSSLCIGDGVVDGLPRLHVRQGPQAVLPDVQDEGGVRGCFTQELSEEAKEAAVVGARVDGPADPRVGEVSVIPVRLREP